MPTESEGSPETTDKCSILLVEDNPLNQKVVRLMLSKYAIEPDIANHGEEAVEKVKESKYDLILMDLHMPGMHGVEAAGIIREMLGDQCPPIVALTADVYHASESDILSQGLSGFLTKPISSQMLRDCVEKHTGLKL
ncbi:response regulator [Puniceicoccales bacterium CK1056]|uniref:Response regulator n=1 Tax=Oceanipulchritudo coccoides TaxID=2706888 RepID=A0A6B2M0K9_9BACT|nr:response regulator [Oceanipulchritudo coccoides]NDV61849.1 response regulator [Oceanipulchritudo coccoides]